MSEYRILFLGDIVGRPGRVAVREALPSLIETHEPTFVIVNGENSAGGVGITGDIADELYQQGVHAITLGNHAFNKKEIIDYFKKGKPIIRPSNMPSSVPGPGHVTIEQDGIQLWIANLCGRVFLDTYDDPFREIDRLLADVQTPHRFIDFHAEATSEKIAFGYHVEGRATAVVGTHTHVQTADETILPGGTAFITDVGMCGPIRSVLGMSVEVVLEKFKNTMPTRFEVAMGAAYARGVVITAERETGHAVDIERILFGPVGG